MRTLEQIVSLLAEFEHGTAEDLEDQDLDFKQWNTESLPTAINLVVNMAICMANGGGGTVIFGVADKLKGRQQAILGVPPEIDINRLKKAVYDQTDPKITPVFDELFVPEGTGRLLVMHIYPGIPPYTNTAGGGTIRIGKECKPLTGTLRGKIAVETGETDFTASTISARIEDLISPAAMEKLRILALREKAPQDLMRLTDMDLLLALGLLKNHSMTRAGLLIAGHEEALKLECPAYQWCWLRMESDTRYSNRVDGRDSLPLAIERLEELINRDNPITTLQQGLFHFEYRIYPEIALREALLNAFCHADYRIAGPIMIKQYSDRLEISNNGGFIAGITPENILHHPPAARNPLLVGALVKLRLINRSNLGISRMFEAMLVEGKEPPFIQETGESITVTFQRSNISPSFRLFIAEESQNGRVLSVDHLLILQYLIKHPEMDTSTAAHLCQRQERQIRDVLNFMERMEYLEHGGVGRGVYWMLNTRLHKLLAEEGEFESRRRINWEAAKTRVLSILTDYSKRGEGLSNQEIRKITHFDRYQTIRLMKELSNENPNLVLSGQGRYAKYIYKKTEKA